MEFKLIRIVRIFVKVKKKEEKLYRSENFSKKFSQKYAQKGI